MKVNFGEFEEMPRAEALRVKDFLMKFFEPIASEKYDSVHIAYPHQAYSDDYLPKTLDLKQTEIYIFSIPKELGENTKCVYNIQPQKCAISSPAYPSFIEYKLNSGKTFAISKCNKVWILSDIFHAESFKSAEETLKYLVINFIHA